LPEPCGGVEADPMNWTDWARPHLPR
jgi:hypothetical protein